MGLQKKFYEKYNINPENFEDVSVEDALFSFRVFSRLKRAQITTIGDLLKCTYEDLARIGGFGTGCFKELYTYFESIASKDATRKVKERCRSMLLVSFRENRDLIVRGDFSFACDDANREIIEKYIIAREMLGEDLANLCLYDTEKVVVIRQELNRFAKLTEKIYKCLNVIPCYRRNQKVKNYIYAYTGNEGMRNKLFERINSEDETLEEYIRNNSDVINDNSSPVFQFIKASSYDLFELGKEFFDNIAKNERAFEIVKRRSEGMTLEQVGHEYSVTRERVRQVEKKVSNRFVVWIKTRSIIDKINAELDGKKILLPSDLDVFFDDYGVVFGYLLKINEEEFSNLIYEKQIDVFVIGNENYIARIQEYVDELPDTFNESQLDDYFEEGEITYGYPREITEKIIQYDYGKTGDVYHRARLTFAKIYADILQKYYPCGIWVYSDEVINDFRSHIKEEYGDIRLPENNRAILARIVSSSVLCDRGTYCSKKEKYISDELAQKIHDYIRNSDIPVFLTNTLFSIFEDELVKEGVTNKYYLQGILKELYEGEFVFRRDYVSKDAKLTSVYSEIVSFIEKACYPVTKRQINEAFPGVTEIVISISVSDPDVINLFGVYVHASKLKLEVEDKNYIRDVVDVLLDKSGCLHCKDIYEYINRDNSNLLTCNGIYQAFGLFSVLEYLYRDELEFSRPYIGKKGQEITRTFDQLHEMVEESDVIQLAEVISVAKENHFQINSILEFANSCNKTHLLLNDKELAAIDYIGLSQELVKEVEQYIYKSITGTVYVSDLQCIKLFPRINVPWTEWLIYSAIKKWGNLLDVAVTSTTFRQAKAVLARRGELDISQISEVGYAADIYEPDNMEDIDELISEILFDEIEG